MIAMRGLQLGALLAVWCGLWSTVFAQAPAAEELTPIRTGLEELRQAINELKARPKPPEARLLADVEVYAKAVEWCLAHNEFYVPKNSKDGKSPYSKHCLTAITTGKARAAELADGKPSWPTQTGTTVRGYVSRVDGSVQPYALSLPAKFAEAPKQARWPLHIVLHGRGGDRNEVRFNVEHDKKPAKETQHWIQLDVFGRTDNAYRWAGETDVFEAITDVSRRYRIDDHRLTLRGFSMGGAGSWHLGLHHPSQWSSVGPGAGFVDFYKYQKQTMSLPDYQHRPLRIYDSIDYTLNAANVPVCTYGGELDEQLVASTSMIERAKELKVPMKLLIGPGVGHKFHPETEKEFLAFHIEKSQQGRIPFPGARSIRFVTHTLKYNRCEWLTIEELGQHYEPAIVEGGLANDGVLRLKTQNIVALQLSRDVADNVDLDGTQMPLNSAGGGLLPGVFYVKEKGRWSVLDYDESIDFSKNPDRAKRHNLQGPIDDAFMEPFVCVRGTGTAWSPEQQAWTDWTFNRFEREFSKWMRAKVPVITDKQVTPELMEEKHLVLFGDPGSNALIAEVLRGLPVKWEKNSLQVNGQTYDTKQHGVALIYPNPLQPNRYVVINSGHTMHDKDFQASNAWLFPKLGDIAVLKFEPAKDGYQETTVWADLFDDHWELKK